MASGRLALRSFLPITLFALIAFACTGGNGGDQGTTSTGKVTITVAEPQDNPGDIQARQTRWPPSSCRSIPM